MRAPPPKVPDCRAALLDRAYTCIGIARIFPDPNRYPHAGAAASNFVSPKFSRLQTMFRNVVSTFHARPLFCTHDTVAT